MTYEEHLAGDYEQGYRYELIDGTLYVSPFAELPENVVEQWLTGRLQNYAVLRPYIINYITNKARVFVPGRRGLTIPEPDLTAYARIPFHLPLKQLRWQDFSPILVSEILTGDPEKDLGRNVELYFQVPSIQEYWVVDARDDPDEPSMRVHRRQPRNWRVLDLSFGSTYTTELLPDFQLLVDPHR